MTEYIGNYWERSMKTNYGDGLLLQSTEWIDCTVCEGLDGSTSGLERERLINLFNADDNNQIRIFLLSTR